MPSPASEDPERQPVAGRGRSQAAHAAALALAAGKTVEQAARDAGVSDRTIYRWQKRPRFRAMVAAARGRLVDAAAGVLSARMSDGAAELARLLRSRDPNVRLRAAVKLIELGLRAHEYADLEGRVRQLEGARGEAADEWGRPRAVESVIGDDRGDNACG